jgi:hypothetical protein
MGFSGHVARQQFCVANVRFGSKADVARDKLNVHFTPNSRHWNPVGQCPLCAKSRLMHCNNRLFDHLIGCVQQAVRHVQAKRICCL